MATTTLKPCPFCGRKPKEGRPGFCDASGYEGYAVACSNGRCCIGPVRNTKKAAEQAWNKRKVK